MGISDHLKQIRSLVGTRLLCLPSVTGILRNEEGHVLLVRNTGSTEWTTPGGMIEPDERPGESVVRELKEELGVDVAIVRLLGVFSGPEYRMLYPNGDEVVYTTSVFECRLLDGEPNPDYDELEDCQFVSADAFAQLETPAWVKDLFAHINNGETYN